MMSIAGTDMKIARTVSEISSFLNKSSRSIGLVPTMGSLHEGHIALIKKARSLCKTVVVSIFVNPTQFAPDEDLNIYPRDFEHDKIVCENSGADIIFYPSVDEIYPNGFLTAVKVNKLTEVLEGESRPSHFEGVTTIVAKLFNIIHPNLAFFGKKDAQQLIVIQKMIADLNIPTEIVSIETVREPNGLAYSSRNIYLSDKQRKEAVVLYQALKRAESVIKWGQKECSIIEKVIEREIKKSKEATIDYISCNEVNNLSKLSRIIENNSLILLAVFFGKTRLIDNIWL